MTALEGRVILLSAMKEKGFSSAQIKIRNIEKTKLEDLDFLRSQPAPEPFTTSEEVTKFIGSEAECDKKN